MISLVAIAQAAAWPTLRTWFNATEGFEIGAGVRISPTGLAPTTHLGMHAWIDQFLFDQLAAQTGVPWITVTHADDGTSPLARFNAAMSANGLALMLTATPPFGPVAISKPISWDSGNSMAWDGPTPARLAFTDTP